jgi:hypothetical protein
MTFARKRVGDGPPATTRPASASSSRRRRRLRRVGAAILTICVLLLVLAGGAWAWLGRTATSYSGAHFNRGENAVWLEHTWSGDPHSAYEYDQLADQLTQEQIRYVFLHVGPLNGDGSLPPDRARFAGTFVSAVKQRAPGVRVLAWIGQLERASGLSPQSTVDLSDPSTRQAIATTAAQFAGPLGFDGVHYDIEPMLNNSPHFLDLLDVTRSLLPPGKLLSISAPMWAPNAHVAEWMRSTLGKGAGLWTSYYYAAVAKHVDQLVVMEYNTAIPNGPAYRLYVKQQTQHILDAVRSARNPPEVLVALPSYHENGFWFHDSAENLGDGLPGVVDGLNSDRGPRPFAGVAIYRFGTTGAADWRTYDRLWLGK